MEMPTLDSQRGAMDDDVFTVLGSPITYTPAGGSAFVVQALINSQDMEKSYDQSNAIALQPQFTVRKSDLTSKPMAGDRFTSARYPGKTFKPANVMSTKSGSRWKFEGQVV